MTSFTAINSPKSRSRRGFTLVEMLVVIGIIVVLIGILMPALNLAYSHSVRTRMQLDIQTITTALEAYRSDQRAYPQLDYTDTMGIMKANYPGAVLLWLSIVGGGYLTYDTSPPTKHGSGFQVVQQGQVYGPYVGADRFKMVQDQGMVAAALLTISGAQYNYIADRYGHPILYFKANLSADPTASGGYVANFTPAGATSGGPRYNLFDNCNANENINPFAWTTDPDMTTNALIRMQLMLGDSNANGKVDTGESPVSAPYLLWSAGPDEVFGIDLSRGTGSTALKTAASFVPNCDDATNFSH